MEKIVTKVDAGVAKDLFRKGRLTSFIIFCAGLVGIILFVILGFISQNWTDWLSIVLLVLSLVLVVFSGYILVRFQLSISSTERNGLVSTYEFKENSFHVENSREEEKIEEAEIDYKDVTCFFVRKHYIFLQVGRAYLPLNKQEGLIDFLLNKGIAQKK